MQGVLGGPHLLRSRRDRKRRHLVGLLIRWFHQLQNTMCAIEQRVSTLQDVKRAMQGYAQHAHLP